MPEYFQILRAVVVFIFLVLTIDSFHSLMRKKYGDAVFYLTVSAVMAVTSGWSYMARYVFHMTGLAREVSDWIVIFSYAIAFSVFVFNEVQKARKKNDLR